MKKSYITLFAIVFAGSMLVSNNAGVTTVQNKDRTGSPVGEINLCNNCHSGAAFTTSIDLRMLDGLGNQVTEYNPGETYLYEIEVTSTGASAYGFQTVGLRSSTNAQAGTLTAHSSNTKTKILSGRTYGEHTMRSNPGLFQLNWTAPAAGTGKVNFYATAVGCNANSASSGDKYVKAPVFSLTEHTSTAVNEQETTPSFSLYPQPVSGNTLNITGPFSGTTQVVVADITGRIIYTENRIFVKGAVAGIDVQSLQSGTFILVLLDEQGTKLFSSTFIKQ